LLVWGATIHKNGGEEFQEEPFSGGWEGIKGRRKISSAHSGERKKFPKNSKNKFGAVCGG